MDGEERGEIECPLAVELADRLRRARHELTRRWLDRVTARSAPSPERVVPAAALLNQVPLLLAGLADYMRDPAEEISAEVPVVAKAMELGQLRLEQGFEVHEILKEYEFLGSIVFSFLMGEVDNIDKPCSRGELIACAHRLSRGMAVVQQVTLNHYLLKVSEQVRNREAQLRSFNRMVSHELKNRLGTVMGASDLLVEERALDGERAQLARIIQNNARELHTLLESLLEISRIEMTEAPRRGVSLRKAAMEAARQIRGAADARGVAVRLANDLPDIPVNAAVVELCLSNYLSNAVKYSDPKKPDRWAEVRAQVHAPETSGGAEVLEVEVRDNGISVPADRRDALFQRFERGHDANATNHEGGLGLGLAIVRETVESLGGHAWAEFRDEGSSFFFSVPLAGDVVAPDGDERDRPAGAERWAA